MLTLTSLVMYSCFKTDSLMTRLAPSPSALVQPLQRRGERTRVLCAPPLVGAE